MHTQSDTNVPSGTVARAEELLASLFQRTGRPTRKVAGFQTRSGRQLAIERDLQTITIWTGTPEAMCNIGGAEHYSPSRTRHSNLKTQSPRLYTGHAAAKWRLPDLASVETLARWYAAV